MSVRQAREYAKLERSATALRPAEALPRRLQACMQELLAVNERYHELLQASEAQRIELEASRAELARLRPAVPALEAKLSAQTEALHHAEGAADDLRAAHELQRLRCAAAEAERDDLHKVVAAYAARLLEAETELGGVKQRNSEAEAWLATHWQAGYEEGVTQQKKELKGRLHRAQERASAQTAEAFERGKLASTAAAQSRLDREEAERKLLVQRAEEARNEQRALEKALQAERTLREAAEGREREYEARLRGVRHHKSSLANELATARAAHTADLQHFDQMENALGMACAEYSALAVKHARAVTPPRVAAVDVNDDARGFGCSPPEAMRTRPPVPAAQPAAV